MRSNYLNLAGLCGAVALGLALFTAHPASALPTASVGDLTDAGLIFDLSGIDILDQTIGTESWEATANLHIPFGDGVLIGTHHFVLTEPGSSAVSDIFTVTATGCPENDSIGACEPGPDDFLQQILLSFQSDGETPLALPTFGTIDCNLVETGSVQSCDISHYITLQVASDVEPVPEPASLALLGVGLAGLGVMRRRRAARS